MKTGDNMWRKYTNTDKVIFQNKLMYEEIMRRKRMNRTNGNMKKMKDEKKGKNRLGTNIKHWH